MLVIFLRHGEAEPADGSDVAADQRRKLTSKGRDETEVVAAALDRLHIRPDVVLTSPLVRAVQSAEVAATQLKKAPDPVPIDSLAPGHRWSDVRRDILKACPDQTEGTVLLCGHQPDMGEYVAAAIAQRPGTGLELRKSAAVCVSWDEPGMAGTGRISLALEPTTAKRLVKIAGG